MPVITLQLGQCGNQLGCSFFQALAGEFSSHDYGRVGVEEWFRPIVAPGDPLGPYGTATSYVARSVMIDMEPKGGYLCMQSGAGNNWAHGYHGYGPRVREAAMDLVRREVEACDVLGGFLLLQSMAGGTGAGLGTYVADALREEGFGGGGGAGAPCINACVWPYESGEVIVQSYNTLLTLSHLADVSDGVILLENEGLHRVCTRLHSIARPSFGDMNAVAARALSCALLPSSMRHPGLGNSGGSAGGAPGHGGQGGQGHGGAGGGSGAGSAGKGMGMRGPHGPHGHTPGGSTAAGHAVQAPPSPLALPHPTHTARMLGDLVEHLCPHPAYRMLSLRSLPQIAANNVDFTTFTWPALTKRLRQMLLNGSFIEEGLDWGLSTPGGGGGVTSPGQPSPASAAGTPGAGMGAGGITGGTAAAAGASGRRLNKSLANWLVLRGQGAGEVDVASAFGDAGLYPFWATDPLAVSWHPARFARCGMAAAMLSNDQACVAPMRRMQERAAAMLASRAFVHQYEAYGLGEDGLRECLARCEEVAARYSGL